MKYLVLVLALLALAGLWKVERPAHVTNEERIIPMELQSTAFAYNGSIPEVYTCEGENRIPPLSWQNVPAGTQSLVLIAEDPDIPESVKKSRGIQVFDHWVVFDMPATLAGVEEGKEPQGTPGNNGAGKTGYIGPCPPDREHRYFFHLYALDAKLGLPKGATKAQVLEALSGHVLGETELVGLYNKKANR